MTDWITQLRGRFIVFDGPDGSGKSTQFSRLAALARENGIVVTEVREPGGTSIGEQIRSILLDPENATMNLQCEMLLYMASRAQLIHQRIQPALARNQLVLADRFISSTLAYQGTAGGLSRDEITAVGDVATAGVTPDLVVVFDVDEQTAAKRLNPLLDRMEQKGAEFHRRVRQGFLQQAKLQPQRYTVIDATAEPQTVFSSLCESLSHQFPQPSA